VKLPVGMASVFYISSCVLFAVQPITGQQLEVSPFGANFTANADSLNLPGPESVGVGAVGNGNVQFQAHAMVLKQGVPNFLVVSPSSGSTPSTVWIALNPNIVPYMPSGGYTVALQFAVVGQTSGTFTIPVTLKLIAPPSPGITAVVNAATLQPGISPGALVSILGTHLGTQPVTAQYDGGGLYPIDLSSRNYEGTGVRDGVTFNGIAAPLLYESTGQINVVVPYGVAGNKNVDVIVTHNLFASAPFTVPILDTSPGIFTVTQNGNGQGAILNNELHSTIVTANNADNPAPKGSVISIFATGAGLLNQIVPDGSVFLVVVEPPGYVPSAKVSVTIGGQPAQIQYAGLAPFLVAGMIQVNALVPFGIASGQQPIVLTIGQNSNSPQNVTVAVQ
jgi:trimeric autotransporter adhesin